MLFPQQSTEWNRRLETIRTLAVSIEGKYQNTMVVLTADMNQVNIQNIAGLRRVGRLRRHTSTEDLLTMSLPTQP